MAPNGIAKKRVQAVESPMQDYTEVTVRDEFQECEYTEVADVLSVIQSTIGNIKSSEDQFEASLKERDRETERYTHQKDEQVTRTLEEMASSLQDKLHTNAMKYESIIATMKKEHKSKVDKLVKENEDLQFRVEGMQVEMANQMQKAEENLKKVRGECSQQIAKLKAQMKKQEAVSEQRLRAAEEAKT
jgi:hypothetical protein